MSNEERENEIEYLNNVIKTLYESLSKEFTDLQRSPYPKHKLDGYEDALWDFKIIAKEKFDIDLPKVEKQTGDNMICNCRHTHKEHLPTSSINYTGGRCTKCTCKNFIYSGTDKLNPPTISEVEGHKNNQP